jgi:hypothetical protein
MRNDQDGWVGLSLYRTMIDGSPAGATSASKDNALMLYGDGKKMAQKIVRALKES